jgi:hypothetical protein
MIWIDFAFLWKLIKTMQNKYPAEEGSSKFSPAVFFIYEAI